MGLDQYLKGSIYISLYEKHPVKWFTKEIYGEEACSIRFSLANWRKANQIHKWFVDKVQDGSDDCKEYYVARDKLKELYKLCCDVISNKIPPQEGLPTQEGFFFGDTEYDDMYMEDLKYTRKVLKKILGDKKYKNMEFYYSSSW